MMNYIEVEHYGAVGDGVTDDTAAINTAVADCAGKCELLFSRGKTYMINAEVIPQLFDSPTSGGIILRSGSRLKLNGATLRAIPNAVPKYAVILVTNGIEDVVITGGRIEGERDLHTYGTNQTYPTDEFGYGVQILNAKRVKIENVEFYGFTGDGVFTAADSAGVGPQDVTISGCSFEYCRRQGVSVTRGDGVSIINSRFDNIGGTSPGSGIDIESGAAIKPTRILIDGNISTNTVGYSITNHDGIDVVISNNYCDRSISCGYGDGVTVSGNVVDFVPEATGYQFGIVSLPGSKNLAMTGNTIKNASAGFSISGSNVLLAGNVVAEARDYGIYINADAQQAMVSANNVSGGGSAGIYSLAPSARIEGNFVNAVTVGVNAVSGVIQGNSIISCPTAIHTSGALSLIVSNTIDQSGTSKAIHNECTDAVIKDNTITNNSGDYLIYTKRATITGNVLQNSNGYAAIYLVDPGNTVAGNTLGSATCSNGVLTASASTDNIITWNTLREFTTGLFITTGANTIVNNIKHGGVFNIAPGQTANVDNF